MTKLEKLLKLKKTNASCKTCGFGSYKDGIGLVLCGNHLMNFKEDSLCEDFVTPIQRRADAKKQALKLLKKYSKQSSNV